ncbi:hypothetical protein BUALT_Bualt05G0034400 [Buddleja alternifolia]|uniref:Uncharacterized protein n=1 Tax=Buddleja alternifolia TaxID=168488 RepID=A0AAV6XN51_9LAMI|nr:hypothetical protein BUALT_Bualt05G0034400 [Buddleja alternifolia]
MALLFELATSVVGLALKPLLLAKLSCQLGARSIFIVIHTWLELLRVVLCIYLVILWRLFTSIYCILVMQLQRLKKELEYVLWDRKELEERLNVAVKERRMMEVITYLDFVRPETKTNGLSELYISDIIPKAGNILTLRKEIARSRSLFSAILSLVVGMVVWKAENRCMPLVVALFTVVTVSLGSVIELFSNIDQKPASDAVALLSLNWFVLGTFNISYVTGITRVLTLFASRFLV